MTCLVYPDSAEVIGRSQVKGSVIRRCDSGANLTSLVDSTEVVVLFRVRRRCSGKAAVKE